MPNNFNDIDENRTATYKQSWAVGYHFAKTTKEVYPQFTLKKLANLIKGTIFYYHKDKGEHLTHGMVQEYLENDNPLPSFYKEHLNKYLKENDVESDQETSKSDEDNFLKPAEW
jgi:hypothetical protein